MWVKNKINECSELKPISNSTIPLTVSYMSEVPDPDHRPIYFRSQQDFRRQLISALIQLSKASPIAPKRRINKISQEFEESPAILHERIQIVNELSVAASKFQEILLLHIFKRDVGYC